MEHRGDGPDQARPERRADGAPARALRHAAASSTTARASGIRASSCRAGRSTCFWRAGRRADLARPGADRERARRPRRDRRRRRASSCIAWRFASASIAATSSPATRTSATTSGAKASCRSTSSRPIRASPTRPSAIACATSSSAASASRSATRCRSPSTSARSEALALDALVPAQRPLLPGRGRFAARLSPAARFAAVGARRRLAVDLSARRQRRPAAASGDDGEATRATGRRGTRRASRSRRRRSSTRRRAARTTSSDAADDAACARCAGVERIGRLRRPHRDQRRGAPRPALHLHAADVGARGLPRARRRGRGDRARRCACR